MIKLKQLILEADEGMFVRSDRHGVSVMMKLSDHNSAVASIDNIGDGRWWVSRVLVGPPHGGMPCEFRGKGIGSMLIRKAVQEVLKMEPNAQIIVEPGGTYGSKEEDQLRFYRKNGFTDVPNQPGVMVYRNQEIKEGTYRWVKGI